MASIFALLRRAALTLAFGAAIQPAAAQNPFEDVARVNDSVVTAFEVQQRARLLKVLRRPENDADAALETLVDDRLRAGAARRAGIDPSDEDIRFGMENFAGRANLTLEEFLMALDQVGIAEETLRDYVTVLLVWGEVVRERFGARARPSEEEIDRALALGSAGGGTSVSVAEIVLPVTPDLAAISEERAGALAEIRGFTEFETAARQYSVAPSASNGGQLGWVPVARLPQRVGPLFLTMSPGDVTPPMLIEGGIVLYQLRGLQDSRPPLTRGATVDFMRLRFPPGTDMASELGRLALTADRCDDLYGIHFGASEEQLLRETQPRSALPRDLAAVIDRLDPGEIGGLGSSLIMLCARTDTPNEDLSREEVQRELFAQRLESYGAAFLEELRADAFIETLQ